MGWFTTAGDGADDPSRHVVSLRRTDDGRTAGAGFVIGPDTVLTCAHVVNTALGRAPFESRPPGNGEVPVELFDEAWRKQRYAARVAHWVPPRTRDGGAVAAGGEWRGDLAVLRVDGPPSGLPSAPRQARMTIGQKVGAWHGGGHASTLACLTVTALHDTIGYVDGEPTGMAVGRGYSGSPLWCAEEQAVVGMVVAHFPPRDTAAGTPAAFSPQNVVRRSWVIPWQAVEAELRPLGALGLVEAVPPGEDEPAFQLLAEVIGQALPSPSGRGDRALRLARLCGAGHGSDVVPPTPEEFAAFLLTHPRALAALTGILRRDDPEATDRLLAAGAFSHRPRLLSPAENTELRGHLRAMDPAVLARFPEAVRAALPHLAVLPGGDTVDALLDCLEALPGDGHAEAGERRVPALLRVMEYMGALCPEPRRAHLRMWADRVSRRLGIERSALAERRHDAQEWVRSARTRTARLRVLVQVTRAGRGRHSVRIWSDEGSGPRQVSRDSTRSYTASEAAREVLRVLDSLPLPADDERPPLVEVLVDRHGLNLPVDEWAAHDPGEPVPGVLGVEFPLVVHCPELLRRNGRFVSRWRSRWNRLETGGTVVVSDPDRDTLYSRLVNQLDTVRVSVDVPPGSRDSIVQTCLALGIPVVMWDRGRDGTSHSIRCMTRVATPELPDGVHSYRASAKADPPGYPGRPVLAWADADRAVPRLHLTEPQEGT